MAGSIDPEDVEWFDRWSRTYERSWMQWLLFDRIHRNVLAAVPAGLAPEEVLDIGCGTGRLLRKVAERWPDAHLYGVDPAEGMIAAARHLSPVAEYTVGFVETLPLPDESVDLVISTMSFHHWQSQEQGICQIWRVLRAGGCFVLADVALPSWVARFSHHGRPTNAAQLKAMLAGCGMQILAQKPLQFSTLLVTTAAKNPV